MNWESGDVFEENHPMEAETGNLVLAEALPGSGWKELTRVNGVLKQTEFEQGYPHLAFAHGRIVCRNMEGDAVCLSVQPNH